MGGENETCPHRRCLAFYRGGIGRPSAGICLTVNRRLGRKRSQTSLFGVAKALGRLARRERVIGGNLESRAILAASRRAWRKSQPMAK